GLAYDASGALNVATAGAYRFRVTAGWDAGDAAKAGACAVSFAVAGAKVVNWSGPVGAEAGHQVIEGRADLQAGPQPAALHVACDQPQGARFRVELALQAPGDSDLRPPGFQDIMHGATAVTA